MKLKHRTLGSFASLAGLLAILYGTPVVAGPNEDYKEGSSRYAAGDLIAAMPALRKAADAGHAQAQALIADILTQEIGRAHV